MIWFTADTHLGHKKIIEYSERPFASIEEMDTALIDRWNEKVGDDDEVYFLGDFCWGDDPQLYLRRLKGKRIYFVIGSHDRQIVEMFNLHGANHGEFDRFVHLGMLYELRIPTRQLTESGVQLQERQRGLTITLCHYAMRRWPKSHYGTWHVYGHSHGHLPHCPQCQGRSLDCGVDTNNFYPYSFTEIARRIEKMSFKPNHPRRLPANG